MLWQIYGCLSDPKCSSAKLFQNFVPRLNATLDHCMSYAANHGVVIRNNPDLQLHSSILLVVVVFNYRIPLSKNMLSCSSTTLIRYLPFHFHSRPPGPSPTRPGTRNNEKRYYPWCNWPYCWPIKNWTTRRAASLWILTNWQPLVWRKAKQSQWLNSHLTLSDNRIVAREKITMVEGGEGGVTVAVSS